MAVSRATAGSIATRPRLAALAVCLAVAALSSAPPAAATSMTLPAYVRDDTAVADHDLDYLPIGAAWALADGDGDGLSDIIFAGSVFDFDNQINIAKPVQAFRNLGNGDFALMPAGDLITGTLGDKKLVRRIVVGDVNGDTHPDLLLANTGDDFEPYGGEENTLLVSNSGGDLQEQTAGFPSFSDYSHGAAIGDVDGDGDLDIVVANSCCGAKAPYLLVNDGQGDFTLDEAKLPDFFREQAGGRNVEGDVKRPILSVEIVDVNGDGKADLLLGFNSFSFDDEKPSGGVLLNPGSGDFSNSPLLAFPTGLAGADNTIVVDIEPYDIDDDGIVDLLVSEPDADHAGARVQVLIGNGDGTFRDESFRLPTPIPIVLGTPDLWVERLEMVDFNGDGAMDLLLQIANAISRSMVFVNNGYGFFQKVPSSVVPNQAVHSPGTLVSEALLLPMLVGDALDFVSPDYECTAGSGNVCTNWRVHTSVFRPNGTATVDLNFKPGARDDSYKTLLGAGLDVAAGEGLLANDVEPDSQPLSASLVSGPGNGSLSLSSDGGFSYTPNAGFSGTDSFTYRVSDGVLDSNTAQVDIEVDPSPIVVILNVLLNN